MTRRLISRPVAPAGTAGRVWLLRAAAVVTAAIAVSIALLVVSRPTIQEPQDTFASVYGKYGLTQPDVIGEAAAANISNLKQRLSDDTPILSHYRSLEHPDFSHLSSLWAAGFPARISAASIDARVSTAARTLAKGNESEAELLRGAFYRIRSPLFLSNRMLQTRDIRFAHTVLYVVVGRRWPGSWSFPGSPGEFRTGSASPVAGALSAHALEAESALEKLVGDFNSRCRLAPAQSLDAAVCALHFYVNFIRVYPFPDGNHRVGMAIMWAMLARKGLPPPLPAIGQRPDWGGVSGNETKFIEEQIAEILSSV